VCIDIKINANALVLVAGSSSREIVKDVSLSMYRDSQAPTWPAGRVFLLASSTLLEDRIVTES
jgi:hypothetical protein